MVPKVSVITFVVVVSVFANVIIEFLVTVFTKAIYVRMVTIFTIVHSLL